jgi:hypothetical protein
MNMLYTLSQECIREKLKKKEDKKPSKIKWKTPLCQDDSKHEPIYLPDSPRSILSNSSSSQ